MQRNYSFTGKLAAALAACMALAGCGGDSGGGGGSAPPSEPACRNVASRMAVSGDLIRLGFPNVALPATVTCDFDSQRLQLTCRANYTDNQGGAAVMTKTWTYGSVTEFVKEAGLVGVTTSRAFAITDSSLGPPALIPDRPIQGSNSFDSSGRMVSSDSIVFNGWDANNRPISSQATLICTNDQGHRYVYDDATRQVTHTFNTRTSTRPPDGTIPCIPVTRVTKYDTLGNITDTDSAHYEVLETKPVCP